MLSERFRMWLDGNEMQETVTLPETNIAPKNGWLEYDRFLLEWPFFRCENVSFRECMAWKFPKRKQPA